MKIPTKLGPLVACRTLVILLGLLLYFVYWWILQPSRFLATLNPIESQLLTQYRHRRLLQSHVDGGHISVWLRSVQKSDPKLSAVLVTVDRRSSGFRAQFTGIPSAELSTFVAGLDPLPYRIRSLELRRDQSHWSLDLEVAL